MRRSGGAKWSTSYRDAMRVRGGKSFFRCGVTGMPRFRQLIANQRRNGMGAKAESKAMVTAKVAQEMDTCEMKTLILPKTLGERR